MQTRCVQIANTVFHSCHQLYNIDRPNKCKQQITNNLQLYSCARSQHAHAFRVNWLNIITIVSDEMSQIMQIRVYFISSNYKGIEAYLNGIMNM